MSATIPTSSVSTPHGCLGQVGWHVWDGLVLPPSNTTGVDMVIFDWTNQIPCILDCDTTPCDCSFRSDLNMVQNAAAAFVDHQVTRKSQGKSYLRYTFFIGPDHHMGNDNYPAGPCCENHYNGNMLRLGEQIKSIFLEDPRRAPLYYKADGRPLLFWWLGATCCFRICIYRFFSKEVLRPSSTHQATAATSSWDCLLDWTPCLRTQILRPSSWTTPFLVAERQSSTRPVTPPPGCGTPSGSGRKCWQRALTCASTLLLLVEYYLCDCSYMYLLCSLCVVFILQCVLGTDFVLLSSFIIMWR